MTIEQDYILKIDYFIEEFNTSLFYVAGVDFFGAKICVLRDIYKREFKNLAEKEKFFKLYRRYIYISTNSNVKVLGRYTKFDNLD